ncbi:MAG: hypothetical protein LUF92_14600 [Clostridiales bacterium]|nr:hypothetical protein [Clostridiales bacterium]
MFYDNVKASCARRNTNITTVLADLGRSTSGTGRWKVGGYPRLDVVMEIAEYLKVSVDELAYGRGNAPYADQTRYNEIGDEWIEIISHIPQDRQQLCKDFLRTHMVVPEKYSDDKEA